MRHKHSLSHERVMSCKMGQLIPIGLYEILPGDTVQQATSMLVRVAPLLAPVMHRVDARIHHWFVPYRLLWEDWEDFITGGSDGMDASVFPTMTSPTSDPVGYPVGTLADYLGIPTGVPTLEHSALPFRAYAMIFNEWYRDQDLVLELPISYASGPDSTTNQFITNVAWEKDYFTSARPWAQKGPSVSIPISGAAPISSNGEQTTILVDGTQRDLRAGVNGAANSVGYSGANPASPPQPFIFGDETGLEADVSGLALSDMVAIREAFAIQRYQEARARYGSRYTEYLRYLGIRSSDARLQRPEYLGGGKQVIQFSEVLQTAKDSTEEGVGGLYGHGIGAMRSNRYRRYFEEHGLVLSLLSVRPKTVYMNGLPRMWNRRTKEDFWQKELEFIGQQELQKQEVYAAAVDKTGTFGYVDRYLEYCEVMNSVHGEFRDTLDFWHMARNLEGEPSLNDAFVACNPTTRVFQVTDTDVDQLYIKANHSIQARRLVSRKSGSFVY